MRRERSQVRIKESQPRDKGTRGFLQLIKAPGSAPSLAGSNIFGLSFKLFYSPVDGGGGFDDVGGGGLDFLGGFDLVLGLGGAPLGADGGRGEGGVDISQLRGWASG